MYLKSLKGCRLAIGNYPAFTYDARGGGGEAQVNEFKDSPIKELIFNKDSFSIPPLNWKTTKILGIPLPPGIQINIENKSLEGKLNIDTGYLALNFEAYFYLSIGNLIKAPKLLIQTCLKSGEVSRIDKSAKGSTISNEGKAILVGFANIERTGCLLQDLFLGLPTDAFAELHCEFY